MRWIAYNPMHICPFTLITSIWTSSLQLPC